MATLEAKIIGAFVALALLVGGGYGVYEHMRAQSAEIAKLQTENEQQRQATAAATAAANAAAAALNAYQNAQAQAAKRAALTSQSIAAAVAANPDVAKQEVPESYWQAIYGAKQ